MHAQPAFAAINVEPEENVEEEIDTSKELQVDEALKLFQNALKLHAQGPQFFDDASDAYDELFLSDIFKLPESTTEYERTERQQNPFLPVESSFTPDLDAAADSSGTSLPQALFLSYKNHGQFILDRLKDKARRAGPEAQDVFEQSEAIDDARKAIDNFNAALDRDPSDAELWRRTARTAAFMNSARMSRYCLEAAIELDDDPAVVDVEPPSLAEGFAGEELKNQLRVLSDNIALTHPSMKPFLEKEMPPFLMRHIDPAPFLPDPINKLGSRKLLAAQVNLPRLVIELESLSWAQLGMRLVQLIQEIGLSGQAIRFQFPEGHDENEDDDVEMESDQNPDKVDGTGEVAKSAVEEAAEPSTETKPPAKVVPTEDGINVSNSINGTDGANTEARQPSVTLPSRKRSISAAGLQEPVEEEVGDSKRPKRVRRRDTLAEETVDETTLRAAQLQPFQGADQNLFHLTKNILENLGVTDKITVDRIGEIIDSCALEERTSKLSHTASIDLRDALLSYDDEVASVFLTKAETAALGMSTFLEHTKAGTQHAAETASFEESTGLTAFVKKVNLSWMSAQDVAFEWILVISRSYTTKRWSDQLKTAVVQVISHLDEPIHERVEYEIARARGEDGEDARVAELDNLVQMLFEVYLDVYERITSPNSRVDQSIRLSTKNRLSRWLDLALELSQSRPADSGLDLSLRFLWACVFSTTLAEGVARDHILACWHSLRDYLATTGQSKIELPNNAVMPEISAAEADREISKLTTMDFFLGLFREEVSDPVAVIDTLEPVLNPEAVFVTPSEDSITVKDKLDVDKVSKTSIKECASQGLKDLWKFLLASSTDLRLLLWSRLSDAYGTINYTTKQFSCLLKSIEMVMNDMDGPAYLETPPESRRILLMKHTKSIHDMMVSALSLALNDNTAFDIIDEDHLRASSAALARLSCFIHVAVMQEDEFTLGITPAPSKTSNFNELLENLRDLQVRVWTLQYCLIKVGIHQNVSVFKTPENDLADYLSAVHQVLGLRKACTSSNKVFLKMMRIELLKQKNIENWEDYLGQVLYDLHGLKLGVGIWEVQDHGCAPEKLEKRQAMQLVENIMTLANRMSMKDLLKSDLKNTIEHMQGAIGPSKSTTPMIHNLRNFQEYIKKPIHPLRLYQAFDGTVPLDAMTVNTADAALAKHGWFFLLGMIALTKFKGVDLNRRQTPGATDDLRIGATFLRLQLQFTPDMWEAWFRLAECFDYELDEAVLWSADKMNKERSELLKFQRQAIHCYTLALSHSHFWYPESKEDEEKLCQLYYNFAMRMYASSREPFAMEPFHHRDHNRFYPENGGSGTVKKLFHSEMTDFEVWKYAAVLFRRTMKGNSKDWKSPYMVSKCLWKMYQQPLETLSAKDKKARPTVQQIVDALEKTIEVVSKLPKPRHGQDPILEPHYKLVSILHKLVSCEDIAPQEAANIIQRQPYAIRRGEHVTLESDDWDEYVVENLRHLRDKDKSHWQHRIIMRHARIVYEPEKDDANNQLIEAQAAFSILREHMVTKTMAINVWKCDAERPGRHHVFTEQYVRYIVRLLTITSDRVNMEALLRKIRKKGADFYHFNDLWAACVQAYTRLLRHSYKIPPVEEDVFKNMSPEEFDILAERVSDWASKDDRDHPALNAMKETVELKKLNGGLMKAGMIDDLINDSYSVLYSSIVNELPGPEPAKIIEDRNRAKGLETNGSTDKDQFHGLLHPNGLDKKDETGRAVSEAPSGSAAGEKMERSTSNTGEQSGAVRRRLVGVRRADILRKAEQAVLRATEQPPPKSAVSERSNGRKSRRGSAASGKNGAGARRSGEDSEGEDEQGDDDVGDENEADEKRKGGDEAGHDERADESETASPRPDHDDADDESDLSDVPDDYDQDVPPTLMFPNLRRSVDNSVAADSRAGSSSDGGSQQGDDEQEDEEDQEDQEEDNTMDVDAEDQDQEMVDQHTAEEGEEGDDDIDDGAEMVD
ncbi:Histone transcription regulator 3 [Gnomoniopsis smithogilvyi]|uniref:Histone transcription regulator 3 homolog n=1 Tax=Gnomoniopsis smithogilvyi TaxID=1191159 RepID=A0A9W8YRF7_9PEZI|nr:Histone transcription regulator 3 [Gnomoniopsis smithogilvyi]